MKSYEKDEIAKLPRQYRPLGAWSYFGYSILFNIPLLGFIFLVVFALSSSNIARRSYARSYFCGFLIVLIILAIVAVVFGPMIISNIDNITEMIKELQQMQVQ